METIFEYNTRLSFGLGAEHLSVKVSTDKAKIKFYGGTPMHPKRLLVLDYNEQTIEDIKEKDKYLNQPETAMYIKQNYL